MLQKAYKVIGAILVAAVLFVLINGCINFPSVYYPKFEEQLDVTVLNDKTKAGLRAAQKFLPFTPHTQLSEARATLRPRVVVKVVPTPTAYSKTHAELPSL